MVTSFTTREKSVNFDQFSLVPFALILKLTKHFSPSSIAKGASQLMVTNARARLEVASSDACPLCGLLSNSQVFNSDYTICPDQISSQLVQKIGTGIADSEAVSRVLATLCAYALHFGVYFGYFKPRFMSVTRAFGFPTQFFLRARKFLIQPIKMLWVSYLVAVTGCKQTRYANVNTNFFVSWWQRFNSWIVNQQRNEPSTRGFEFNCNSRWASAIGQKPRPDAARTRRASLDATCLLRRLLQRFLALCQPQITISVFKSRFGKLSRATVTFSFKPRILGTFAPKVSKGFLQMSQTLLQRYTTNLIEKV